MTPSEFSEKAWALRPVLRSFALRHTNNIDDADDLIQDTLVKALRFQAQFQSGSNLKAWLFTIMRNTFLNEYKRRTKSQSLIQQREEINSNELFFSADKNSGEGKLILKDIYKALKSIPEVYSVPFVRYFEGYKYHEIGSELNIPIGTVKTRIYTARKLLMNYLKSYSKYSYKTGHS